MRSLIVDDWPVTRDGAAMALRVAESALDIFEAGSLKRAGL